MTTPDNGILASIPGQYVAAATFQLPEDVYRWKATATTDLDVPGFGRVRFAGERLMAKKGKSTFGTGM